MITNDPVINCKVLSCVQFINVILSQLTKLSFNTIKTVMGFQIPKHNVSYGDFNRAYKLQVEIVNNNYVLDSIKIKLIII